MSRRRLPAGPEPNVPQHTIDLSLPPRERYKALTTAYKPSICDLTPLFNNLLADLGIDERYHGFINTAAAVFLRGVHSPIETAELRGIADLSGLPMYLLVSFNVVLDLLMGCTSGAVRTKDSSSTADRPSKLLHFRTLDWGMDPLRKIVVQLNYVRSKSSQPDLVIARSVTYVGFVGVLTGVRQWLSLSLNFRAVHNATTRMQHFRFYLHHFLVLLGWRQSISSILRGYTFSEMTDSKAKSLDQIAMELKPRHTTAAYLTFCNGQEAIILDQDFETATVRRSTTFIAATNHDVDEAISKPNATTPASLGPKLANPSGMQELINESQDRLNCISKKWKAEVRRSNKASERQDGEPTAIHQRQVVQWVSDWPTTNRETHYAAVLDAEKGDVVWAYSYAEPVDEPV